jgi:hypothetical protein
MNRAGSNQLAVASLALARRFAAGATLWCVSPAWPSHGRHVAVEFVHPVIVGKRALPAVHVDDPDLAGALRLLARPGDVLLGIGPAADAVTADVLRRAEAWGLTRVWVGAGPRPPANAADHLLWADEADPAVAARSGAVVLRYHLLWELTHVAFEHPGLLTEEPQAPVCPTCADEASVAEAQSGGGPDGVVVLNAGRRATVNVTLVGPVHAGDLLLVHAGVAIASLDDPPDGGHR